MAKSKSQPTTPALPAAPDDDSTPPGIDTGPFDIPSEWLAGRTPAELAADRKAEAAELKRQRAVIDRAIAIRDNVIPPPWMKQVIREAIASAEDQRGTQDQEQGEPPKKTGERIRFVLQKVLYSPDGKAPANLMNKQIIDAVNDEFRKRHWKLAGDETVRRIIVNEMGRR